MVDPLLTQILADVAREVVKGVFAKGWRVESAEGAQVHFSSERDEADLAATLGFVAAMERAAGLTPSPGALHARFGSGPGS